MIHKFTIVSRYFLSTLYDNQDYIICIDDSQSVPGFVPVSVIRDRFKAKDAKANQPFDTTSQVYDDCS